MSKPRHHGAPPRAKHVDGKSERTALAFALVVALVFALILALATAARPAAAVPARSAIMGGKPVAIEQSPWQVALAYNHLRYGGNGYQRYLCGGTLVAPTVVVTAAHCLYRRPVARKGAYAPAKLEAITSRGTLSLELGQAVPVAEVYHAVRGPRGAPGFKAGQSGRMLYDRDADWDVAVIKLAAPATAPPIHIAGRGEHATWKPGRRAYISGWGAANRKRRAMSDQLRRAQVRMQSGATCAARTVTWDSALKVCAWRNHRATCDGDSGGPLVVPVEVGGQRGFRLAGITSYVSHTPEGRYCGKSPTTFARVAANPIRRALRRAIRKIAGVDVYGSGARPSAASRR